MKKLSMTGSLFLIFSLFATIVLGQCTVYYCSGCVRNGLCPVSRTFSTREEAEASGKLSCPGGGWEVKCGNEENGGMANSKKFTSPLGNGIMGSMLGALGFSMVKDANGNNQWATGAAGGYFFFSTLTYITSPKSRPMGVNILLGALTGATGGYAADKLMELNKKQEAAPVTPAKKDNTAIIVAASAGGGALLGAVFTPKKPKGGYSYHSRKANFLSNTSFMLSGNRAGIIVRL